MKKVTREGRAWCSVSDAASYLGTTHAKVRALMGSGALDYAQIRKNGPLYVSVDDLVRLQRTKLYGAEPGNRQSN